MVSGLQSVYSGGGFFNPYARSVAPRPAQAAVPAAASPEQAAPSAQKADVNTAGGGFYNPAARSIETKK
jgi:hypothetical protein